MVKLRDRVLLLGNSAKSDMKLTYHRKTAKPANSTKIGKQVGSDYLHNCLTCLKWPACKDPKKSASYRCSKYAEAVIEPTSIDELFKNPENILNEEEIFVRSGDDEDSILDMISKVIDSNIPVPPDLRINDHEIPEAANFLQWATDDRFAKSGMPPFPRQVEIGLKIFSEICPRCSDMEWFDDMPVDAPIAEIQDRVQVLEFGICPKCKVGKSELLCSEELDNYYGVVGLAGQRSAKTTSVILWDSYDLHHTLKLPSPQTVYGILDTTPITSTYAATTFAQAVDNVWTPYKSTLNDTPWFRNYHKFLERRGEELGEELFTLGEHMVRYRHRNIVLAPSGPNKRTMRGKSRRSGMVDEIGWFKLAKKTGKIGEELELMDAKGVFDALDNSLITLKNSHRMRIEEGYNTIPKPMMYIVSSPSQYNDFIMSSHRLYSNSPERYCFKYATWEFNPLYKKKHFKEAYKLRPVETARDFECNPPIGEGLFITDHASLIKSFNAGPNKIQIETKTALSKTKNRMTTSAVRIITNSLPNYGTILCVDVGIVNNSFSFAIVGPPDDYDGEDLPEDRGTMQVPARVYAVGEIIPKPGTRISLTSVYTECFIPLIEPFNISYFVSDRWQNAKIAQDIEDGYEVTPLEHKCSWEDFETTRDLLYSGNLQMPRLTEDFEEILKTTLDNYPECFRNRPVDHLAWQFATVREQTGVTVLKGEGGTDDSFRTIVLGVAQLQNEEILEELLSYSAAPENRKEGFLGMVVKVNGGGRSSGSASSSGEALGAVKRFSR